MLRDIRMNLASAPLLGSLRRWADALRALPLPKPLQRLSERGLARLRARLPELAALLDGRSRPARSTVPPSHVEPRNSAESAELLAQLAASDYRLRVRAVQALVHQRAPEAVDALRGALRDRSVEVAVAAVGSLQIVAGRKAQRTLREVVDDDQHYYHPLVRAAAVHALGALLTEHECAPLVRALRAGDAEVSIAAIGALCACAPLRAAELLLEVVENREGFFLPITRLAAARGLERLSWLPAADLSRVSEAEGNPQLRAILGRLCAR